MFISRLFIVNYRSIRELDLRFRKGKNVVIPRNNCGKSNVVKALHIILGETSPTYHKSENMTIGDFHSWKEKTRFEWSPNLVDVAKAAMGQDVSIGSASIDIEVEEAAENQSAEQSENENLVEHPYL